MGYTLAFIVAAAASALLTPVCRWVALRCGVLDHPVSSIKSHTAPVPYLGGIAVAGAFFLTIVLVRLTTDFPTGTLHAFRGVLFGGVLVLLVGLTDDLKYRGIHFTAKFAGEIVAVAAVMAYDIRIIFVSPEWLAVVLTMVWVVGMTNALNLIDVMDGLAAGVGAVAALSFFVIGIFNDGPVLINYAALALAGGCIGFLPYNLSSRRRIFMGDTGALFIGLMLAVIALGSRYSTQNRFAVVAPLLVLFIPLYDTVLVSVLRMLKGRSPFLGSRDHFSLRLQAAGMHKRMVLVLSCAAGVLFGVAGFTVTQAEPAVAGAVVVLLATLVWLATARIVRIPVE